MRTIKEYIEESLKTLEMKDAKNAIVTRKEAVKNDATKDSIKTFYQALASGDRSAFKALNEATRADYKEKAQAIGTIGTGTSGGLLVPTTVADSIVSKMNYISPLRQIATVISNMPAQLQLPSENALPQAYWASEGVTVTPSGSVFDPNLLTPFKAMGLDNFTSEVLQDAATNPSIQNYVEQRFAIALALLENGAFVNGTGTGMPWGFRSSAITPNSVAQAGTTVGTLAYSDLTALKYSIKTGYRARAIYVTSSLGLAKLENLKDTVGRPLFLPSIRDGAPDTLLGRPIYIIDEIPANLGAATNATEIWFGLFDNYFIGDRAGIQIDYGTTGSDFANDMISLRMKKRVAGRPVIGESFSKLTGVL
jgi:HK97 family phage major capsid protein